MTLCPDQGLTGIQGQGTMRHNPDKAGPLGRNSLELSFKTFMENIMANGMNINLKIKLKN